MSFGKAERFKDKIPCGPPPTAYDPKHPAGGGAVSFPKGDRFLTPSSNDAPMTRSHSSSSVNSNDSASTQRSASGKGKDHSQCNKQIAELEKELRSITLERNQLLRRKNNPSSKPSVENKENEPLAEIEPPVSDEVVALNQTIQYLQGKLEEAKVLREELEKVENERDNVATDLELNQLEIAKLNSAIDELKATYKDREEALRTELAGTIETASEEKEKMKDQMSALELKIENLENVRVELVKEIKAAKEAHEEHLTAVLKQHEEEKASLLALHSERVQELENNLQQSVAEHDAENEQIKFDCARQIEELNQTHKIAVEKLESQHAAALESLQSEHAKQIQMLQATCDELTAERSNLILKCDAISLSLETKSDDVETLRAQLDVTVEKMEALRIQSEEKYESMKRGLELDIAECRARFEEQRRNEEETMRSHYEQELATLSQSRVELSAVLVERQNQLEEVERNHAESCQQYEEQIQRLNENNHTEKEILMWQMNQQKENLEQTLQADYERQIAEKECETNRIIAECEAKYVKSCEERTSEVAALQSEHELVLSKHRQQHEAALENLQLEKTVILQERAAIEDRLKAKEAEVERVTTEMKDVTAKLQLDLDLLRESNNGLVADLLRVEQERLANEERLESEKVELVSEAEAVRAALVQSHEVLIVSMRADLTSKEEAIAELNERLSAAEETSRQLLEAKEAQMEQLSADRENRIREMTLQHNEEVAGLVQSHEQAISEREMSFAAERGQLNSLHLQATEELKQQGESQVAELKEEFRLAFCALERKTAAEKEELIALHSREQQDAERSFQEKLDAVNHHHQAVVEQLNKNCEDALDQVQYLQQSLEELRTEHQSALAAAEVNEVQSRRELETMSSAARAKDEEVEKLREAMRIRDKQTADEWIQRETALMSQFSAQNQQAVSDYQSRLSVLEEELKQAKEMAQQMKTERNAARDDISVYQVQTEAQINALNEQYEEERAMLLGKLGEQMREINEIHNGKLNEAQSQLTDTQRAFDEFRHEAEYKLERMQRESQEAVQAAVRNALAPVEDELESLRRDREAYLLLQKEYQDLKARIEPFREQLEMFEAEKKALLSQAMTAESSMASLAAKYTQLLGHTNSKQKIHHLDKLKQDIFNLRKELADKNLALEKEKKARQKADARIKELTGQKKYDPAEAFKVPESPATVTASKASKPIPTKTAVAVPEPTKEPPQRKPLRSQPTTFGQSGSGFFLSMDDVEKTRAEMEQEKQRRIESRRQASSNFEAFEVDFGGLNSRRETFDVPPKLNVTQNLDNKENTQDFVPRFPQDLSCISMSEDVAQPNQKPNTRLTSTPVNQRRIEK